MTINALLIHPALILPDRCMTCLGHICWVSYCFQAQRLLSLGRKSLIRKVGILVTWMWATIPSLLPFLYFKFQRTLEHKESNANFHDVNPKFLICFFIYYFTHSTDTMRTEDTRGVSYHPCSNGADNLVRQITKSKRGYRREDGTWVRTVVVEAKRKSA